MPTAQKPDALLVVDDLRLLAASMRHSAGQWMVPGWDGHKVATLLEKAQASLLAKEAECEALKLDAARLDYLQSRGATVEILPDGSWWKFRIGGLHSAQSPNIRAAIDAARAAADQGGA